MSAPGNVQQNIQPALDKIDATLKKLLPEGLTTSAQGKWIAEQSNKILQKIYSAVVELPSPQKIMKHQQHKNLKHQIKLLEEKLEKEKNHFKREAKYLNTLLYGSDTYLGGDEKEQQDKKQLAFYNRQIEKYNFKSNDIEGFNTLRDLQKKIAEKPLELSETEQALLEECKSMKVNSFNDYLSRYAVLLKGTDTNLLAVVTSVCDAHHLHLQDQKKQPATVKKLQLKKESKADTPPEVNSAPKAQESKRATRKTQGTESHEEQTGAPLRPKGP